MAEEQDEYKEELIKECKALGLKATRNHNTETLEQMIEDHKAAAPTANVPPNTVTTADQAKRAAPTAFEREEEEKKRLMDVAAQLGIIHLIDPLMGAEAIQGKISHYMTEKAQQQAVAEAAEGLKSGEAPVQKVKFRVSFLGDGKIGTGQHIPGVGNLTYKKGDVLDMNLKTALAHQKVGRGEILED